MTATFPGGTPSTAQLRGDLTDNAKTFLSSDINDSVTTIPVDDTADFPAAGLASIKRASGSGLVEVFSYTGKTSNTFTGVTRDFNGKGADSYSEDDEVHLYWVADHHNRHVEETIAIAGNLISRFGTGTDLDVPNGIGKTFNGNTILKSPSVGANSILQVSDSAGAAKWNVEFTDASGQLRLYPSSTYNLKIDATQVVVGNGSAALPSLAVGLANQGLFNSSGALAFSVNGYIQGQFVYVSSSIGYLQLPNNHYFAAPSGTAAAPSYTSFNYTSTGMFFNAGPQLRFSVNGSLVYLLTSTYFEMQGQQFRAAAGNDSAPGISFWAGTSTGIYRAGTNILGLAANEVYINRASAGGNIYLEARNTSSTSPSYAHVFSRHNNGTYEANMSMTTYVDASNYRTQELTMTGVPVIKGRALGGASQLLVDINVFNSGVVKSMEIQVDGSIRYRDGSASAPSQSFQNESNLGTYRPSAGEWAVAVGGNRKFRVTASAVINSNYGGTTTPSYTFTSYTTIGMFRRSTTSLGFACAANGNFEFHEGGTLVLRWDGGGQHFSTDGLATKVVDLGTSVKAYDDVWADDFQNVADIPFFDHRRDASGKIYNVDDMEIIRNIKPLRDKKGNLMFNENGYAYWDDATLPDWLWTKKRFMRNGKRGPLELARDPEGKPWIAMKVLSGLALGVAGQLVKRYDNHERRIRELEEEIALLKEAA